MVPGSRAIVIVADPAEAGVLAAALKASPEAAVEVLTASTPADACGQRGFRDAELVVYDGAAFPGTAKEAGDLFPHAAFIVLGNPGDETALENELRSGASDYVLRDAFQAYLRLLPLKVSRLLGGSDARALEPSGESWSPVSRLEENLRQSEIRFGQLVQAIPDIVYHLDPDGSFVFVNASVSILGYTPADLIGRHFSFIIHPEDLPYVSRAHVLKRHREGSLQLGDPKLFDERRSGERRTRNLIVRLMTKPGGGSVSPHRIGDVVSYGVIEAMGHYEGSDSERPRRDPESFRGTVGIIHDITMHRRSEEMIRVLLQAVDQSPLPIVVTDGGGVVDFVNPRFLRDSGLLPEQVIGRNVAHLTESPTLRSLFRRLAEAVTAGGEWRGGLDDVGGPHGSPWRDLYVSPVRDPLGRTTHFIALLAGNGDSAGR